MENDNYDEIEHAISPGEVLLKDFMEPLGLSQHQLAKDLGVPQSRIGDIITGKRGITLDTVIRLSVYFKRTIKFWMNLQINFEIAQSKLSGELEEVARSVCIRDMQVDQTNSLESILPD